MSDKRRYVRMSTVFPVELEVLKDTGEKSSARLLQGFTRDISAGGMCIELKSFGKETEKLFLIPNAQLALTINPTFAKHPIKALAKIAWLKKQDEPLPARYLIGVAYVAIDAKDRQRIFHHAKRLLWIPRIFALAGIVMMVLLSNLFLNNQRLIHENKLLVQKIVEGAERKSGVASEIYELQKKKIALDAELKNAKGKTAKLEMSIASLTAENMNQKESFEKELKRNLEAQNRIAAELKSVRAGREKLEATYKTIEEKESLVATSGLKQMYQWIKSHQNLRTGLVASFEGDAALEDSAFTYDEALACQTFLIFNDIKPAENILSFYTSRAEKDQGAFFNAYDAAGGHPMEATVHTGPNIWLGIAALQFEHCVKDGQFLALAKNVGDWVMEMQDGEGGVKGGPSVEWYSTEHNLDAYAFFRMLYETTHDPKYKEAEDKALGWIKKYAYSVKEKRINRGKGDATIATDTFSWAIAALSPATLKEINFDPEAIMEFAETHCEVSAGYKPNGKLATARGFDFAKAENIGRGGIISTEWTAQMIVAYEVLSDYFKSLGDPEKSAAYRNKANFYLNELQKLIITSPSRTGQGRGCLPYASTDNADTGHGWRTPKGPRTGSVAGTAYGLFAWVGYNPFDLEHKKEIR